MDALRSFGDHILKAFKFPKPYNWGYPVFFGAAGMGISFLALKLMYSGTLPFSSTSLIGCAIITILIVMLAFVAPSVLLAEHGGLFITGHYTGVGALILSFLSGAPLYLIKASFHNLTVAAWLRAGGSVIFPAVFYQFDQVSGSTLMLELLIDTIIPAFGFSLFFLGAVWQGFSEENKRWAFIIIPLLMALFSFDFLDIAGILVIGWWLCMVRSRTENIYGPILTLIGSRLTGILIDSVVSEVDLTTIRVYSDIPGTIYYSSVPALFVAVILLAFFRKTLGEFHFTYSADIYGDDRKPEEKDGVQAESPFRGINLLFILGMIILAVFWFLLFKGMRL
jgi:hypothetical protein